jgi:predicted nucleic acid-binding protein
MKGFLLDTNCISEDIKPKPNPGVVAWLKETDFSLLYLSVLTLGEVRKGIEGLPSGRRKLHLQIWLDTGLRSQFGDRLLPIDGAVAERWGLLESQAKYGRRALPIIDGLLAATAIEHDLTVVTRNTKDFDAAHVSTFNPWT